MAFVGSVGTGAVRRQSKAAAACQRMMGTYKVVATASSSLSSLRMQDAPAQEAAAAASSGSSTPKKMPTSVELADLKVGAQFEGVVRTVTDYGAFVDIGAPSDGLLHVSQMSSAFVKDPNEIVTVGEKLAVRVLSVDLDKGNFSLSVRDPDAEPEKRRRGGGANRRGGASADDSGAPRISWDDYTVPDEQAFVEGKVVSITDFGAFIDIGAPTDGMVHISSISQERVESVSSILSLGQAVQVRVVETDPKRNRISLAMTPWEPKAERNARRESNRGDSRGPRKQEPVDVEGRASSEEIANFVADQPEHLSSFAIAWERAQAKSESG